MHVSKSVVRDLWLVLHRDLRHTARVRALADFLVEMLHRERVTLRGEPERPRG
ncbi:hypothetical protein [Cystobacter ferrugineus]|uniref:hypothetical protein n=1 Tax=Cystobacter ferrugineus TaxID=83449 RepID=UPI0016515C0F|nr:hypothetical protein [Cystobacter ferrugineus]